MAERTDALDLGYLSDEDEGEPKPPRSGEVIAKGALGKDFYDKPKGNRQGGRTLGTVERGMRQMGMLPTPQMQRTDMATVDVRCTHKKGQNVVEGDLIMKFNDDGIYKMPVSDLEKLQVIMRARPGRYTIKLAPAPKPIVVVAPPAPEPELVEEPVVEEVAEEVAEEEPVVEEEVVMPLDGGVFDFSEDEDEDKD